MEIIILLTSDTLEVAPLSKKFSWCSWQFSVPLG